MGHVRLISMKALMNGLPLILILTLGGKLNVLTAVAISLVVALIAYLIGDLLILPAAGNAVATVADGGLVFALLYLLRYVGIVLSISTILWSVVAVLLVEGLIYHPYLKRLVSLDSMGPKIGKRN